MAKKYSATNPRLKAFAERFREYVDDAGGVNKVSAITGISRVTIGFWYNGERTPDAANMITLAEKTNISVDWFLGLCDERTRDVELKAVCKYTGLSEKAINNISGMRKSRFSRWFSDVITDLLEHGHSWVVYEKVHEVKKYTKDVSRLMAEYKNESIDEFNNVCDANKYLRLALYELNEEFNQFIREVYDIDNVLKEFSKFENDYLPQLYDFMNEEEISEIAGDCSFIEIE